MNNFNQHVQVLQDGFQSKDDENKYQYYDSIIIIIIIIVDDYNCNSNNKRKFSIIYNYADKIMFD